MLKTITQSSNNESNQQKYQQNISKISSAKYQHNISKISTKYQQTINKISAKYPILFHTSL